MNLDTYREEKNLNPIWHPCSQMKDYELFKPLEVVAAQGAHIELKDGRQIIDANSSWWCKSLGHGHPRLKAVIKRQIEKFEHVALANTTNEVIVNLSEKLTQLTRSLSKVFYASDGSSAIEVAIKMSAHARKIQGEHQRTLFVSLENSYHGESIGALSVSDLGIYRDPYTPFLFDAYFISALPYVNHADHPLWVDCGFAWRAIEKQLEPLSERITAILVEPIVQGAGGMRIYSQDFLRRLCVWARQHGIHVIADEIMTGIGRTGKMLACEYANVEPDFLCLSKGLTAGWLPLSAVLTTSAVYDLFYDDYASGKSFLHSHTYSGNVLAASIAVEVLAMMKEDKICDRANQIGSMMRTYMQSIADKTQKLTHVRQIGAIVAADLVCDQPGRRLGFEIYQKAVALGALLRPLGNTLYWLPPLTIDMEILDKLKLITEQAILSVDF
ncbi:adenosylmethionine--8-amino-7-oxononanoate transaminase [Aquicella lusitana]|uniref:Adenosylmethionine-8-amino-7-oxononanoate aminotransferase n=1 Tax=Aquicella lusitana TaxID=254246 RepID=A0A370GGZ9_9COXI|nr:adenosylmethionine--8-amino-7-oxononanoate transaminase [Aquicella lusitana]RDI42429.1 adenosylmethionine-8-amino-7-oxononanoate aminotransferase [Aquicella lusitana]VVC74109.1 Adenosylmethionine-8-amino-7-oxononanoate aminotransferase [Aquicella lusitana]